MATASPRLWAITVERDAYYFQETDTSRHMFVILVLHVSDPCDRRNHAGSVCQLVILAIRIYKGLANPIKYEAVEQRE